MMRESTGKGGGGKKTLGHGGMNQVASRTACPGWLPVFFNTMQWWEVCSDMAFQTTLGQEEGAATLGEATLGQHRR